MTNLVMARCKQCRRMTKHLQPSTSHVFHLLMSIITVGFWVVIWVLVALSNGSQKQCEECGQQKGIFG